MMHRLGIVPQRLLREPFRGFHVTIKSPIRLNFVRNIMSYFPRQKEQDMKSIITTYPDFQILPRGVKAMLLTSESHFFQEAKIPLANPI